MLITFVVALLTRDSSRFDLDLSRLWVPYACSNDRKEVVLLLRLAGNNEAAELECEDVEGGQTMASGSIAAGSGIGGKGIAGVLNFECIPVSTDETCSSLV